MFLVCQNTLKFSMPITATPAAKRLEIQKSHPKVAFLFEAVKLTWKRQPWQLQQQRQQPSWQRRQQRQQQKQLQQQQMRLQQQEQQRVPEPVQEQLLPSCHKRPKQQQR
jgi:hypothetical protein